MKQLDANSVDLVITSPPYGQIRSYNGFTFDFVGITKEIYRVLKNGGVCVWVVGDTTEKGSETGRSFKEALYFMSLGFKLWDTMIYMKGSYLPQNGKRYDQRFEYMFVFSKGTPKTFNPLKRERAYKDNRTEKEMHRKKDGSNEKKEYKNKPKYVKLDNVWKIKNAGGQGTKDKLKHPAIYPEELAEKHILSWSNPGDVVLDCMSGSGTSCKMAKLNNRIYIGFDCSQEYVDEAIERVKKYGKIFE